MIYAKNLKARIEELEAHLAAMTAERDRRTTNMQTYREWWIDAANELETYRAAIPRAYAMGLEAAAREASRGSFADGHFIHRHQKAKAIRALTPPADLVERVLKGGKTGRFYEGKAIGACNCKTPDICERLGPCFMGAAKKEPHQ